MMPLVCSSWVKSVLPSKARLHSATNQSSPALAIWISSGSKVLHPVPEIDHQKQATWSDLVHKSVFNDLLSVVPARDRLRLKSLDVEGAGMWLAVIPSEALGLSIPSNEFTLLLRWWLGEHLVWVSSRHIWL